MADTDVILTVDLDVQDAEKTAAQLQKEVENIFSSRSGKQSARLTSLENQLKQALQKVTDLRQKMQDLADTQIPTEDYAKLTKSLEEWEKKADQAIEKMGQLEESGKDIIDPKTGNFIPKYAQWVHQLEQAETATGEISRRMKEMENKGTAFTSGADTTEYQQYEQELDTANDKVKQLIIRHSELAGVGGKAFSVALKGAQALKNAFTKLISGIKKAVSAFKNLRKSTGGVNTSFKSMLKNILRFGLGIGSVYMLINKLRSAVKEGFSNMYKDNKKFKDSVDSLKGSLTTLKNAFASAFQPIVSIAIPYIQKLVDWMTQLMDQIARFVAAAVGQKYYMKAIKQTGKAAEKAKRQLAGFDELNVLSSQGNGGGKMFEEVPIDEEKIDLLEKLKEIVAQMESVGAKVGTAIRDALNSIDWDNIRQYTNLIAEGIGNFINGLVRVEGLGEAIGRTFAEVLNTIMQFKQTLFDTIDFEDVGRFFGNIAQSFVETFDWKGQGHLIATEINSIAEAIKGFSETFDGFTLGFSFADMLNQFFYDIDWNMIKQAISGVIQDLMGILNGFINEFDFGALASTISNALSTALTAIETFLTSDIDFDKIGEGIVDLISNVDWIDLLIQVAGVIATALLRTIEYALELLWGMAAGIFDNLANLFEEMGWDSVAGFFKGMADNLRTSIQAVKDWFNQYLIIPFKEFFGIHSPSTLFADFGKMLILGLVQGIRNALGLVGEILTALKTKFLEKFQEIKLGVIDIVKKLWEGIKAPINSIIGGFEFLVNCVIRAINKMIDAMNGLSFDIPDWVPEIGGSSFGFSIPTLNEISIPRLAQGAVIPPNQRFLAMLGDQKSGTNVEAPLTTIQEALVGALQQMGFGDSGQPINIYLGTEKIYSEIRKMEKRNVLMGG